MRFAFYMAHMTVGVALEYDVWHRGGPDGTTGRVWSVRATAINQWPPAMPRRYPRNSQPQEQLVDARVAVKLRVKRTGDLCTLAYRDDRSVYTCQRLDAAIHPPTA